MHQQVSLNDAIISARSDYRWRITSVPPRCTGLGRLQPSFIMRSLLSSLGLRQGLWRFSLTDANYSSIITALVVTLGVA